MFPSTNGGRYFTINIGGHEVAFSTLGRNNFPQINMILVDKLIFDFKDVIDWIVKHNGDIESSHYKTALQRATSIFFEGDFESVNNFFSLNGVRRALIAYWSEALIKLNEENRLSLYAKHHNWNAVNRLYKKIYGMK